jgi:hypothetical protein
MDSAWDAPLCCAARLLVVLEPGKAVK